MRYPPPSTFLPGGHSAFSARNTMTIFQNQDDLKTFEDRNLVKHEQAVIIRGSGVDQDIYEPGKDGMVTPQVILIARMLWDKGIGEFVQAAKLLLAKGTQARFILIASSKNREAASSLGRLLEG